MIVRLFDICMKLKCWIVAQCHEVKWEDQNRLRVNHKEN